MYTLEKHKKKIVNQINKILEKKIVKVDDLEYPPNPEMGDLSLPCFSLAKKIGKSPADIASYLMSEFDRGEMVKGIKIVGFYLNFTLNKIKMTEGVLNEIKSDKNEYGKNGNGKGKRVMIEFSNANTHKEFHVGHLRNLCYGDSVVKLLNANGSKVIPVSYINDFGIHVAKTLWAYKNFKINEKLPENKGYFLGQTYVLANTKIEEDKTVSQIIEMTMKSIESRKGEEYELWKKTRQWSIEQFDKIYNELEVKFDDTFYESDFIEKGLDMVGELYEKEVLVKSEGAVIANLEKYDLGVLMFVRSNGTTLYPVADLALAGAKFDKYNLDKSIYVTDNRQGLHFKQLFKVLELTGHKEKFVHLGYDVVKLPFGMMSSRSGNVITYEDLREQLVVRITEETKKRHKDWSEEKIKKVAHVISVGVIKFEMLKVGANQIITFDIEKALEFSGFTVVYLQYSCARISSIIRKSKVENLEFEVDFNTLLEDREKNLVLKLAKYPEIVIRAGEKYDSSIVIKYIFELGQMFNDYYHSVQILSAENKVRNARLVLLEQIRQVIENGLQLLGIEILEEM
ncbi:arginine--tRNA ligase [Candidatus Parcubacteria bacterium]|nr:arginine--tRNA ligase [Candidatus Parcubacteria bacterium]